MPASISKQTLRQAKNAYRTASGPRTSDLELRRIKRTSELLERAEHIKKKERRKELNKKKKVEKEQKEKDAKKRMGIEEEEKVGPRQVRIGTFLGKRKRDDEEANKCLSERGVDMIDAKKEELKPKKIPLQEVDGNISSQKLVDQEAKQDRENRAPHPKTAVQQLEDDDWTIFLDSNTQIEREISIPTHEPFQRLRTVIPAPEFSFPKEHKAPKPPILTSIQPSKPSEETFDILDFPLISTQDLDFIDDDPHTIKLPASPIQTTIPDFPPISTQDLEFSEEDLEDLGVTTTNHPSQPATMLLNPEPKLKPQDLPAVSFHPAHVLLLP